MEFLTWHVLFVLAIAYVLWEVVAARDSRSEGLANARFNYINFGVALSFSIVAFASILHMYYSERSDKPTILLQICFITWTGTVCVVLWQSSLSRPIKGIGFPIVLGTLLLHYLFDGGITQFLVKLDGFLAVGGGATGAGLRASLFLKWLYFFIQAFVVLHYYGVMYEISNREKIRRGERKQGLREDAIDRAIMVLSVALSFLIALAFTGTEIGRLSLFSGLVAAGVSIALKDVLANLAAGALLLWDKSIKLDDVIALDKERYGVVRSMTMRYLVLEDRNDIRFLIPNSELLNKTITNWTQTTRKIRLKLDVGVAYDSDIEKVKDVIKGVCLRVSRVLQDPPPRILILSLAESTISFQVRFFIDDPENGIRNVMSEIYELLLERFKDAGITIPVAQREIRLISDRPVRGSERSTSSQRRGRLGRES